MRTFAIITVFTLTSIFSLQGADGRPPVTMVPVGETIATWGSTAAGKHTDSTHHGEVYYATITVLAVTRGTVVVSVTQWVHNANYSHMGWHDVYTPSSETFTAMVSEPVIVGFKGKRWKLTVEKIDLDAGTVGYLIQELK